MKIQILVALICLSSVFVTATELSAQHVQIGKAMIESYMQKPDKDLFKVYHFIFAKAYSLNSEEALVRYKLFKKAVKFVKKHNARNLSWTVGLNQFADMTDEEYQSYNGITKAMIKQVQEEVRDDEPEPVRDDEPDPIRGLKFLNSEKNTFSFDELADKVDKKVKHDCDDDKKSDYHENDSDGCDEFEEEDENGDKKKIVVTNRDFFENLTDVRNQGGCGSCWAFATTLLLEIGYNHNNKLTGDARIAPLSVQQLVDCDPKSGGCGGGWMPNALEQIVKQGGIAFDSSYPYKAVAGTCGSSVDKTIKLKGKGFKGCAPYWGLNKCTREIWWTIIEQNPCSVAIDTNNSEFKYYSSGVMDISKTQGCGQFTHAVVAYAWKHQKDDNGTIREYISIRNSWGTRWGEEGDFRIYYDEQSETCHVTKFCIQPDWA
jgi:C1A family cysteine protease